jgi:hypothetical protein
MSHHFANELLVHFDPPVYAVLQPHMAVVHLSRGGVINEPHAIVQTILPI